MIPAPAPKVMPTEFHQQLLPHRQLIYLITNGQTTLETTPATEDFARLITLAKAAVGTKIDLFQIREKNLNANVLYALTSRIAEITRGSDTKLLVNDRADIAAAAGADGVHLATNSLSASVVRQTFGENFLIGVSTHSLPEAQTARADAADFIVYGPVFNTPAKEKYGESQGLKQLEAITAAMGEFPVLALGGITLEVVRDCIHAGARGVAAIVMLSDPSQLGRVVNEIRVLWQQAV